MENINKVRIVIKRRGKAKEIRDRHVERLIEEIGLNVLDRNEKKVFFDSNDERRGNDLLVGEEENKNRTRDSRNRQKTKFFQQDALDGILPNRVDGDEKKGKYLLFSFADQLS